VSEPETELGRRLKSETGGTPSRKWWRLARTLLGLLALRIAVESAGADTVTSINHNAITTPFFGQATLYPSTNVFPNLEGKVTAVRITLYNVTHTFPADYDILLVGPGGQKVVLMSDCGGGGDLNNVTLTFSDFAPPLPKTDPITAGTYRPTNYSTEGDPTDTFPPNAAQTYSSSLSVFNNTSIGGVWSLYVVDDDTQDSGTIAGGWSIEIDYTGFRYNSTFTIPGTGTIGVANPYPALINVGGLPGNLLRAHVTLLNLHHSFPDDLDVLLVGPNGQNAIIMSDVGGGINISEVTLTLGDAAASSLPDNAQLNTGRFKPTNINDGVDIFPGPAPAPAGTSALSVFNNTNPNGAWKLFIVDDTSGDSGDLVDWMVDFDLEPPVLGNISTRLPVQTGDNALIGGFIVTGTQPKDVIVRALGPSLPVPGKLSDPTLELRDGKGGLIMFNDDWQDTQAAAIIATGIPPTNSLESAIVATLPANNSNYTAIVRGLNNATGVGLVEVYDLNRNADSRLANISTRGLVETGNDVLIAGTIALGWPAQRVIIRALGPSLPVAGKLSDPTLELRDESGTLIASNDDWRSDQESEILSTTIAPTNNLESAIVTTLPANGANYTAIVRGFNDATGVGLVEIYALN
jgi:subtilisin-like proprotein convertase family protein